MSQLSRPSRGTTTHPPSGYDIIRTQGRYFPVRLHLDDLRQPGASAFTGPDGRVVSFARRLSAIVYLYRQQHS